MNDPSKDAPKEETVTRDGLTVTMEREGEHGLIYLSLNKGKLPEKYTGAYTTFEIAKQDVNKFFEERKRVA